MYMVDKKKEPVVEGKFKHLRCKQGQKLNRKRIGEKIISTIREIAKV